MQGQTFGPKILVSQSASPEDRYGYKVVLNFGSSLYGTSDECQAQPTPPAHTPPAGRITASAAFCVGDALLSHAHGAVHGATGPDDPKFRRLIGDLLVALTPPYNPNRPERFGSGSFERCARCSRRMFFDRDIIWPGRPDIPILDSRERAHQMQAHVNGTRKARSSRRRARYQTRRAWTPWARGSRRSKRRRWRCSQHKVRATAVVRIKDRSPDTGCRETDSSCWLEHIFGRHPRLCHMVHVARSSRGFAAT